MALPQLWVALTAVEAVGWSLSRRDVSAIVGSEWLHLGYGLWKRTEKHELLQEKRVRGR